MSLRGVAFVTGASKGIGRAIALRLADDGFDVAINDLPVQQGKLDTLSQEIAEKGRKACVLVGNISLEAEVEALVKAAVECMGQLDVVGTLLVSSSLSINLRT
jgi:NAD(P)-dependent dehydrogenase (short-subunit alcohol dehydrogenase family)